MEINYNRILTFLTVAKHMNMNSAAEELLISQPAVSASIRKLEEELGICLFYRHKNKLVLSNDALSLMSYFQQMNQTGMALEQAVNRLKEREKKDIRISFTVSSAMFSALILTGHLDHYLDSTLTLSYVSFQQAAALLLNNETDFSVTSPPLENIHLKTRIIYTEPIGIVLPEKHPLAGRKLDFSDIGQLTFHGMKKSSIFRSNVDKICKAQGAEPVYVTDNNAGQYYRRIRENDGVNAFFSTERNFEINFLPEGNYLYCPVDNDILNRKYGISCKNSSTWFLQYEGLVKYIENLFPTLLNTYNKLSRFSLLEIEKESESSK